jgi:hypothetical protein
VLYHQGALGSKNYQVFFGYWLLNKGGQLLSACVAAAQTRAPHLLPLTNEQGQFCFWPICGNCCILLSEAGQLSCFA